MGKVGHNYVDEIYWCQKMTTDAFVLYAIRLVKLIPSFNFHKELLVDSRVELLLVFKFTGKLIKNWDFTAKW
jgi:hypothetical protein